MKIVRKVPIQVSVHPQTDQLIREAAVRKGVSISEFIRDILERMFPPVEEEEKKIFERIRKIAA